MHLTSTSDIIRVITGSAVTVDVQASWDDYTTTTLTPGRTNTAITTATTTTVVGSPAASTQRRCSKLNIRNKHAASSNLCTVEHYDGSTAAQVAKYTLLAGEQLEYDGGHWQVFDAAGRIKTGSAGVGSGDALVADPLSQFAATTSAQLAGVISDETGTGVLVLATSPTLTTPVMSGIVVWPDNVRQTFNPGADAAGINVGSQAGDPGTPVNGDLWYDSVAGELTARIAGGNVTLGSGGGSGANTGLTNLAAVAINTALISDTDITDDLGTGLLRWKDIYTATIHTGVTAADTLLIQARDVDGAAWTTFITLTANNSPTCSILVTAFAPFADDGAALGDTTHNFSDLFLATGAVVNYANGDVLLTHTAGVLTLGTGNLIVTTAGTATGSVVTTTGTQTLTNKTLTAPTIAASTMSGSHQVTGRTYGDLDVLTDGATITVDWSLGNTFTVTLGGDRTVAFSNTVDGQLVKIRFLQDGTGTRVITSWPATVKWAGGAAPTLTTTASKADWLGFIRTASGAFDGFRLSANH